MIDDSRSCESVDVDPCLTAPKEGIQTKTDQGADISHSKSVSSLVAVGPISIPVRVRDRSFSLSWSHKTEKLNAKVVIDLGFNKVECYEFKSDYDLSVSERAVFTDSTIYILDTQHANAFWREDTYSCVFGGRSDETTAFKDPPWTASKLRINSVNCPVTRTWKMAINGHVRVLKTEAYTTSQYSTLRPLFLVYPMPMSGESVDVDFMDISEGGHGFSFLDYRTGGFGPSEEEMRSGGQDYYYPEYLWNLGTYRDEDQAEARQRFDDTYGSQSNVKGVEVRALSAPHIRGTDDPRGSICRDHQGNTLASVTITSLTGKLEHFNIFVDAQNNNLDIPDTLAGSGLRLYPIGLI